MNSTSHIVVERLDHPQKLGRASNLVEEGEEARPTNQVQWTSLFAALLLQLSEGEHHVDG
jgi:hypothetical protein